MLEGEHGGGRQHGNLLAIAQRFERGPHGYFGFSVADVPGEQPIHGMGRFHVALDVFSGGKLVFGFSELEGVFELALPVGIRRKREAVGHAALGVELQQLIRHVLHLGLDARFAGGPRRSAEPIERRTGFSRAPVLFDQVHARERDVKLRVACVFEQHEIALLLALHDFADADEFPYAVRDVDHVLAGLQIGEVGGEGG